MRTQFYATMAALALLSTNATAQEMGLTGVISTDLGLQSIHYNREGSSWYVSDSQTKLFTLDAKLGIAVSPEFSIQIDAWAQSASGTVIGQDYVRSYEYDWETMLAGAAIHGTYHIDDFYVGGAISGGGLSYKEVGYTADRHGFATVALEAGYNAEQYRVAGQLSYTGAVTDDAKNNKSNAWVAGLEGTYYLTPDMSVTARSIYEHETYDEGFRDLSWGVEGRYKLEDKPLILSLSYSNRIDTFQDAGAYRATMHSVFAGIKIPFGASSTNLRDLDRAVGLDLNPYYYGRNSIR